MTNFKQLVKKVLTFQNRKIRMAFLVFLAVVLSQISSPLQILASGPQFNFLPGDYELLRGANATAGETNWHDPISAESSDTVAMIVYYHNGVEQTVAHNTRIKVVLPNPDQPTTTLTSTGYLWADNASQITDTLVVNSSENSSLEYIPGTTQQYKDGGQTPIALPDGITSAEGINIGNVIGCWQYSGYVVFQVKVKTPGIPNLTINKKVANSTTGAGSYNWVDENTAQPGNVLAYKLSYQNPGSAAAINVKVTDSLPANTYYLAGTAKLYNNATGTAGQSLPDTIATSGISLGNLESGANNGGYIVFQVKVNPNLGPGNYTLINTGKIKADNVSQKQDTAQTIINISGHVEVTINKTVRNVSQNQAVFVDQNTADAGNVLVYRIIFSFSGNAKAKNVVISDILPNASGVNLHYIAGSAKLNTAGHWTNLSDNIINQGVNIGDFNPNSAGYVILKVRIDNCPAVGQYQLVNTGKIKADNISQKQDIAKTILTVTPPPQPYLNLQKLVRNDSRGETRWADSNIAVPGNTLEYYIWFKNSGDGSANGLLLKDVLPANVAYINGTTQLHISNSEMALPDGIVGSGVHINNLTPGQEGFVTFKVHVSKNAKNKAILIDTAHIYSDEGCHAKDTARTTINIKPVVKPQTPIVLAAKTLPSTGGMLLIVLILTSAIVGSYYYFKTQKEFAQELLKSRLI